MPKLLHAQSFYGFWSWLGRSIVAIYSKSPFEDILSALSVCLPLSSLNINLKTIRDSGYNIIKMPAFKSGLPCFNEDWEGRRRCFAPARATKLFATILALIMCNLASALVEEHAAVNESVLCYPAMFVFGDSLSDTGNGALTGNFLFKRTTNRPYGETVPGQPSGRFSDGLLLVDFLARQIGLPLPKPYLDRSADFRTGVNYAVSGSTAQDVEYLRSMLITPLTKYSLDSQINWHISLRTSKSSQRTPSANAYTNGIYVLEIGGNDYIAALGSLKKYSPAYITEELIPLVIAKIQSSTEALYTIGARNFLYVGITPLGCASSLLAMFPSGVKDNNGCLQDLNLLSYNHGLSLLNLIRQLRSTYKDASISNTLDACCGAGPKFPYRFNELLFCSSLSSSLLSTLCPDPNIFINWDGIHFTHNFNSLVFDLAIKKGSYLDPSNAFANCNPSN